MDHPELDPGRLLREFAGGLFTRIARTEIDPDRWRPLIMSFQQFYGLVSTGVT